MKRQLVLSDIDGTILNSQHQLTPAVITAITAYSKAGGHFVLASARPALGMVNLAQQLQLELPIVSLNGALIVQNHLATPQEFTTLFEQPLAAGSARRIYQLIHAHGLAISVNIHAGTHWYVARPDKWSEQEAAIVGFTPETTDLTALLNSERKIHKILCMGDPQAIDVLDAALKTVPDLHIATSRSKLTYLEITAAGVSKSSALLHLADLLNIPIAATMAIGDGENDLPMMETAGLGVAMGNALPRVRAEIGTMVADSDHAGVAEALQKYAL
ncbi:Cof-type HAD-IIB family hydrolase [Lacticaseibacillus zhaodongensis]|uniref:Cof-type HAD-IIB family hydrolase n=1 Tax=Lacticaseibacillus zhaodongensis TaxID=2668065 RepID=UPI0012D2FF99|nr:Cof-type HAD-IIB family hydrolase [Lacticaseibacillus zhaodongensis]